MNHFTAEIGGACFYLSAVGPKVGATVVPLALGLPRPCVRTTVGWRSLSFDSTVGEMNTVFTGLIVSRLLYALPAWGVLVSAGQAGRVF